jgi:hypothetical protein
MLPEKTRREMLRALQDDVNAWPQDVKDAGVKTVGGAAYRPVSRNNEILRTPDDPEATYDYMMRAWTAESAADAGSKGWDRIIEHAGKTLLWEWLMVDPTRSYAPLFEDAPRERIRMAMEAHPATATYAEREQETQRLAQAAADQRRQRVEEMRSGARKRPDFSGLDRALKYGRRR